MSVIDLSAVPTSVSAAGSEEVLARIKVMAGSMGNDGQLVIWANMSCNPDTDLSKKRFIVRFGGQTFFDLDMGQQGGIQFNGLVLQIANRGRPYKQVGSPVMLPASGVGPGLSPPTMTNIDTTVDQYVEIFGQKDSAADTVTLEWYRVELS